MPLAIEETTRKPVNTAPTSAMSPGIDYLKMQPDWKLPTYLWNGTEAMREAGETYLPANEGETDKAYKARLNRTFLYPVFKSTIQTLVGQAFLQDVVVEDCPPELQYLEKYFDSEGRSITEVAYECLKDQFLYGKAHGIIDYPDATNVETLADEREMRVRPYFTRVDPRDLIGWKYDRVGGENVLNQSRVQEVVVEPLVKSDGTVDQFAEIEVYQVRVFYPDGVEVYRATPNSDEPELVEFKDFTLGKVPLVTAYGEKTGFLMGRSPLLDLAWLNLQHWQSSSDQNNILHIARVPIFFAKGFNEGDLNNTVIGANRGIITSSVDAELRFVEHGGAAIDSGQESLDHLERQMYKTTANVLETSSVARQTASARQTDRVESMSIMQTMIDSLETMLEDSYRMAGEWIGVDASNVKVKIADEFSLRNDDPNPMDALQRLNLKPEQLLAEVKRRGMVSKEVTIDDIDTDAFAAADNQSA